MQAYRVVKAPFAGVITLRNVDVGALVNAGSTLLYRIAQTGTLRTYVNVPQTNASSIHAGQPARLSVTNLPGRTFTGTVARTANSLDPTSRTMLVEVQVPNADGALLPGMYAQVDLSSPRANAPLLVPGDALIVLRHRNSGRGSPPRLHRAPAENPSRPRLRRSPGSPQRTTNGRPHHRQPRRQRPRRRQGRSRHSR